MRLLLMARTATAFRELGAGATRRNVGGGAIQLPTPQEAALNSCGVVARTFLPTRAGASERFLFGKTSRRGLSSSSSSVS